MDGWVGLGGLCLKFAALFPAAVVVRCSLIFSLISSPLSSAQQMQKFELDRLASELSTVTEARNFLDEELTGAR